MRQYPKYILERVNVARNFPPVVFSICLALLFWGSTRSVPLLYDSSIIGCGDETNTLSLARTFIQYHKAYYGFDLSGNAWHLANLDLIGAYLFFGVISTFFPADPIGGLRIASMLLMLASSVFISLSLIDVFRYQEENNKNGSNKLIYAALIICFASLIAFSDGFALAANFARIDALGIFCISIITFLLSRYLIYGRGFSWIVFLTFISLVSNFFAGLISLLIVISLLLFPPNKLSKIRYFLKILSVLFVVLLSAGLLTISTNADLPRSHSINEDELQSIVSYYGGLVSYYGGFVSKLFGSWSLSSGRIYTIAALILLITFACFSIWFTRKNTTKSIRSGSIALFAISVGGMLIVSVLAVRSTYQPMFMIPLSVLALITLVQFKVNDTLKIILASIYLIISFSLFSPSKLWDVVAMFSSQRVPGLRVTEPASLMPFGNTNFTAISAKNRLYTQYLHNLLNESSKITTDFGTSGPILSFEPSTALIGMAVDSGVRYINYNAVSSFDTLWQLAKKADRIVLLPYAVCHDSKEPSLAEVNFQTNYTLSSMATHFCSQNNDIITVCSNLKVNATHRCLNFEKLTNPIPASPLLMMDKFAYCGTPVLPFQFIRVKAIND